jgi:hypothetical protein
MLPCLMISTKHTLFTQYWYTYGGAMTPCLSSGDLSILLTEHRTCILEFDSTQSPLGKKMSIKVDNLRGLSINWNFNPSHAFDSK